jgi:hypothetical protein
MEVLCRDTGAEHIDAVARRLGGDSRLVAAEAESGVGDLPGEVLGELRRGLDAADATRDLLGASQRT